MRTTSKRSFAALALVVVMVAGMVFLGVRLALNGEQWATLRANRHLTGNGSFIGAGNVCDRNGEILSQTVDGKRVYNDSENLRRATLHIVGDSEGYIASGVQTAYKKELIGYNFASGIFPLVKYARGNDVALTVDASVSTAALKALGSSKGVVAVCNYKTGELLCAVSSPNYDIRNKPSAEKLEKDPDYTGVYINRFIDGLYTPGSVFKTVTTVCAIQNMTDYSSFEYECTGETVINGVKVTCPRAHGKLDFDSAFAQSCNCAYAHLAEKLGGTALTSTAQKLGFGKSFDFGNTETAPSRINLTGASSSDIAWAGVGQYTTLVNPYHMLTMVCAIANGGTAKLPYAVASVSSPSGRVISTTVPGEEVLLDAGTALTVKNMMRNNVRSNYGDGNFDGLSVCGKTGTAEVGDGKKPHSWFIGFSADESCPLAVVVIVENGGWGSSVALPIAAKTLAEAKKCCY